LLLETFDTDERARKAKDALAKSKRRRAKVARAIAHDLNTHETKRLMHRLARSYEQLAAVVDSKPAGKTAHGAAQ
jgi:N-glycosylase/DNA lyase